MGNENFSLTVSLKQKKIASLLKKVGLNSI